MAQRSLGRRILDRIEAIPFFGMMALFRLLGVDRAAGLGAWLGRNLGPLTPVHRVGRANLQAALGPMPEAEARRILLAMWDNLGRTFGEYPHLSRFVPLPHERCEVIGIEHAHEALAAGKGAILVSGHFSNWELMAQGVHQAGLTGAAVYRMVNNPLVDAWILKQRKVNGFPLLVPKSRDGTRDLIRTLKDGQTVAMLVDQKYHEGFAIPFFGRNAMTAAGPAVLALRMGSPIVPVSIERKREGERGVSRFRLVFHKALEVARTGDKDSDIKAVLLAINGFLEETVRARPHEWLWLHKRWPPEDLHAPNPSTGSG